MKLRLGENLAARWLRFPLITAVLATIFLLIDFTRIVDTIAADADDKSTALAGPGGSDWVSRQLLTLAIAAAVFIVLGLLERTIARRILR